MKSAISGWSGGGHAVKEDYKDQQIEMPNIKASSSGWNNPKMK